MPGIRLEARRAHDLGEDEPRADARWHGCPCAPYSTAAAFVTAMTPALAAEYTPVPGDALSPPIDDQLTIDPPPLSTHRRDRVLHPEEHAAEVDVHRAVVVLHRHVGDEPAGADARDVAEDVEAPELRHGTLDHRLDVGLLGDVGVERDDRVADLGGGVLLGAADVGRQHLRALTDEERSSTPSPSPIRRR